MIDCGRLGDRRDSRIESAVHPIIRSPITMICQVERHLSVPMNVTSARRYVAGKKLAAALNAHVTPCEPPAYTASFRFRPQSTTSAAVWIA